MNLEWGKLGKVCKIIMLTLYLCRSRGERSIFGASLNPLDVSKSAGGSSGGCSAAVSGGLCRL